MPLDSRDMSNRLFSWLLLLIGLGALVARLWVARTYLDFDEWQHIFMASVPRWADLRFELATNAHPPLFFLLLRWVLTLGHNVFIYRSISILAGVGSVVLLGLLSRRVCRNDAVALLCATAFAFSPNAISISTAVRSYQLALFFVLLAFFFYLEALHGAVGRFRVRSPVFFSVASVAAVCSHYFALLFAGACLFVLPAFAVISGSSRKGLFARTNLRQTLLLGAGLAVPLALGAALFLTHAGQQPLQGYLYDFYWQMGRRETLTAFLARNLQNLANLFSPIPIHTPGALAMTLTCVTAGVGYVLGRGRSNESEAATPSEIPVLVAVLITAELAILGANGLYPFGGLLRHQYLLAPFLVLTAFVVLDRLAALVVVRWRRVLLALVSVAIVLNAAVSLPKAIVWPGLLLVQGEYDGFRAALPQARAVYLDHWAAIGYFIHTAALPRTFVRHIQDVAVIDEYRVEGGTEIFYDKTRLNLDLQDSTVYRSIAACLQQSNLPEVAIFFFSVAPGQSHDSPQTFARTIAAVAWQEGLSAKRVVIDGAAVYASFALK